MGRPVPHIASLSEYYADPIVRLRIREYCGDSPDQPTRCLFLAGIDSRAGQDVGWDRAPRYPLDELGALLANGADIARSTWDASSLLIHLDIDYLNVDAPGEAYQHPAEVFFKLEPTYRATQRVLHHFGLPLYTLVTGRGYHFTGQVPLESPLVDRIGSQVPEPPRWAMNVTARRPQWVTADISQRHARAYVGMGLLVEYLAHRILKRASQRSSIPVVLNGTVVGTGLVGRECISIDISYAGDPLDVRHTRIAFSAYQKHRFRPDLVGRRVAADRPPFIAVPRIGESLVELLSRGREPQHAARTARYQSALVPIVTPGVSRVVTAYETSKLGEFHREFYDTPVRRGKELDEIFDSVPLTSLPGCFVDPLLGPNDRLLQPAVVQHVTRVLLARGMKPRDISAIVHSRYAKDFRWGGRWFWLDAETRAEFDVRVFAGLVATGLDRGVDFNCRSAQEKGLCPWRPCVHDLRTDREWLLKMESG
jgi:hypothetical protein